MTYNKLTLMGGGGSLPPAPLPPTQAVPDPRIPACSWLPAKPTPGVAGQSHSLLGRLHQSTPTGFAGSKKQMKQMGHVHHRHHARRRACMPFGAPRVKGGPA